MKYSTVKYRSAQINWLTFFHAEDFYMVFEYG